jgi:hypothetical protein
MNNNENWKTEGLAWVKVDNKLTIVLPDGQTKTITSDHNKFEDILDCIRGGFWEEIPELMCVKTAVTKFSDGHFDVVNDHVVIDGEEVPLVLSEKILEFSEQSLPYEPLVKFWHNLKENPSYRAVQQLYGFLLNNNHALTPAGNFIAYRAVTADFLDKYTKTISNKPGETVKIPRNQVDENPERTCSNGLHAANYEYASTIYGCPGDILLMVEVNPKDVVAIPTDYNQAKMRVCEYKVLSVVEHEYKGPALFENRTNEDDDYEDSSDDYEEEEWDDEEDYDD